MATVAQFQQDDENKPQSQTAQGQVLSSSAPSSTGAAGSLSTSQTANPATTMPSGNPNISQYLQANQGAGQQLSAGITKNVQGQANQIGQNLNNYNSQLGSQSDQLNSQLGDKATGAIQTAFQDPSTLLNQYQDAQKAQTNGQQLNDQQNQALQNYGYFQNLNSGGYNGAIDTYGQGAQNAALDLNNQVGNLQQQTNGANNEMGRFSLLQKTFGQPGYTSGQQGLDQLLLAKNAPALQQGLNGIANTTNQNITNATTAAPNSWQNTQLNLQNLSTNDQKNIHDTFTKGLGDINQNVTNEYGSLSTSAPAAQAAMAKAINSNTFTPEQLATLGINQGQRTYGLTPDQIMASGGYNNNPLLTQQQSAGYLAQASTPEEFARYNALNQLAGGAAGTLQSSIFGDATKTGYNPIGFDASKLATAIGTRKDAVMNQDFQNKLTATEQSLRGLSHGGYTNIMANNFATQLAAAKTPQQAEQMIQQYIPQMHNLGLNNNVGDYSALDPFQNYYNTEFLPSATSQVNTNMNQSLLPTVNNGSSYSIGPNGITYSSTNAPSTLTPQQIQQINSLINSAGTNSDTSTQPLKLL